MEIDLKFVSAIPDQAAFEELLTEFFEEMIEKLVNIGGPSLPPDEAAAKTISTMELILPPRGRTLLATDDEGRLLGCGVLRRVGSHAAEMKHMFVRSKARGTGLGRQLFQMRLREAERMGLRTLYADTVKGNLEMLTMYEKFGFSYIPRYDENANDTELEPFLVYLKYELPQTKVADA